MLRGLAKTVAYSRMPKATFAFLHPAKALKWGAAFYLGKFVLDRLRGRRHRAGRADTDRPVADRDRTEPEAMDADQPFPANPPTY